MQDSHANRRRFLMSTAAVAGVPFLPSSLPAAPPSPTKRPRIAAIFTAFAHRWHAHVLLENFLEPYLFNGAWTEPGVEVVSFYADQFPKEDMARTVARDYRIPLYPTVAEALCLGGKDLAVDAILLIAEHGDYPLTAEGVRMYPRKRLFDECAAVVRKSGRSVPIFCDKHFSYRWDEAREMFDTARELNCPLMAGSSVPLAERIPPLDIQNQPKIAQAVSIHGGPFEMYDIHGLEVLQSMDESRAGGETGVMSVQLLRGDELWAAADRGDWNPEIADAAIATELPRQPPIRELVKTPAMSDAPHGLLVKYTDGLTGVTLRLGNAGSRFLYAHKTEDGVTSATRFYCGPWNNRNLFKAFAHAIQEFFRAGKEPWPAERTLLTTGVLCAAVDSLKANGAAIRTPHLSINYQSNKWSALREHGASWRILTEQTEEPHGIVRGGYPRPLSRSTADSPKGDTQ